MTMLELRRKALHLKQAAFRHTTREGRKVINDICGGRSLEPPAGKMTTLRTIVYLSSATELMTVPQLELLLVEARELNLQNFVTGVLLYNDGNFMQCFEGSEQSVQLTYERILASRRHKDVIELLDESIEQRSFADWQMDFLQPTQAEWQELSSAHWGKKGDEAQGSSSASEGFMLLQDFWKRSRRIA